MPNIIIINDETKEVHDLTNYIGEMGEEYVVRSYNSLSVFLSKYSKKAASNVDPEIKNFSCYETEPLKKIKGLSFATDKAALGKDSINIEIDEKDNVTVIADDIAGLSKENLNDSGDLFSKFVNEDSKAAFADLKNKVKSTGKAFATYLVVSNEGSNWLLLFEANQKGGGYTFNISDATKNATNLITKAADDRGEDDSGELEMLSYIDVLILKRSLLELDLTEHINKIRTHLDEGGYFPEEKMTRFMITQYEDEKIDKAKLSSKYLEDLICLPLDRLLFKQKLEIIANLPEKIKPSYLFSQEIAMDIELSKKVYIEKINDLGLSIINPVPLKKGLPSIFYISFPGSSELMRFQAKVSNNEPHKKMKGMHSVTFDFFGAQKENLLKLKTYLREKNDYKELISTEPEDFKFFEENIFLTDEDKRVKTVAVVLQDKALSKTICSNIKESFEQCYAFEEANFYHFQKKYLSDEVAIPLKETDLYAGEVKWRIMNQTHDMTELLTPMEEPAEGSDDQSLICGIPASEYFESKDTWKKMFSDEPEIQKILNAALEKISDNKESKSILEIVHQDKSPRICAFNLKQEEGFIEVSLTPPAPEDLNVNQFDSIDTIIISSSFIRKEETMEWIEYMNQQAIKKRLIPSDGSLKFIVVAEPEEAEFKNRFVNLPIEAMTYKPAEMKFLSYHISRLTGCKFTKYNPSNIGFYSINNQGYLAKPAKIKELSEFGTSIEYPAALQAGTTVFLHEGIYKNAPNGNLCARLYAAEKAEEGDGFLLHFIYFGINDNFLKFTRSWIRENYAQKKSAQG